MEALIVSKSVYSDTFGPMNDTLVHIKQLVIERDDSLIVVTHLAGKVFVSPVNKGYLKEVKVHKTVNLPDDFAEKVLQEVDTQRQLAQQLQETGIRSQLSWGNEDLILQGKLFRFMARYKLDV